MINLMHGDCLDVLRTLPDNSVDAVVTDPPYGLSFMGKKWDYDVPATEVWAECLRVLKPGGHLLAFAGTRTQHRMAVRIEDAGFEIRDMIAWVYGSGFPKSLDVSKAIDKAAGADRKVVGLKRYGEGQTYQGGEAAARTGGGIMGESVLRGPSVETAPATEAAKQWQGWGTALKPALEPITVARKPLAGTVAANVLAHGTGGMNVDGARIPVSPDDPVHLAVWHCKPQLVYGQYADHKDGCTRPAAPPPLGRWPANLIHDGSDEVLDVFAGAPDWKCPDCGHGQKSNHGGCKLFGAARFFYCAKASKRDRDDGLDGFAEKQMHTDGTGRNQAGFNSADRPAMQPRANVHPTVKPTDLMRYLCRLVTPPGGVVLDPFMGSGSTGKAARLEGFQFIGIEREEEYLEIARARINAVQVNLL